MAHLATLLLLLFPFVSVVTGTSAPALSYDLTTTAGPVAPGQPIQFTATVTNLSTVVQSVNLYYKVPQFTSSSGYPAGTLLLYQMGNVAVGATQVTSLDFTVLSGAQAPPDGSVVSLVVSDQARSTSFSSSATVRSGPAAVLELSTAQSPVTSGGSFSYTLSYHNGTTGALSNAQLSLPLPVGVSFVSADGGGVLSSGLVRWTLSSVAAGASGQVNVNLKAPVTSVAHAPLVVVADLRNSAGQILAQASDAKAMSVTPALSYALTTTGNPVQPGQGIEFTVTVTNLSSVPQFVFLFYHVPQFTTGAAGSAGALEDYTNGYVAAGATQVVSLDFKVLSGAQAPPDGSLITLVVSDWATGGLVSSSATVRSAPAAVLELSSAQSPVTSGGSFSYALAYHNGTTSALSNAQLSLPLPAGVSFASADGGGVLGSDGVVRWPLSSVAAGASGQVNINLKAPVTRIAHAPLVVTADLRNSEGQILAQVSDAKAMSVTPAFSYALTTTGNPVQPGQGIEFTVTVTNLSSVPGNVTLYYDVPQFTTGEGLPAGTFFTYQIGNVAAGATQVVSLDFKVLSGAQAPPDGSLITLVVSDRTNGGLVSSSAKVRSAPASVLELLTAQSPVTSGGSFSYTLAYHNGTTSALSNAQLSLPLPTGGSFASADGGGVLDSDGVVRWTLSSVEAGASGQVNINLKAPVTSVAHAPLVVAAALRNSAGQILAQASDAKAMSVTPALSYALTTTGNPVQPGQGIEFTVTVTNLSSVSQSVTLVYDVPQFTTGNGNPAGTLLSYPMGNVAAGATRVVSLDFTVLSGAQAPPDGSLIILVVSDRATGGFVSSSATVRSAQAPVLELATGQSPVAPGGSFSYTLSYHNGTTSALTNAHLSLPLPVGVSFSSANSGGVLGSDGVVRWTFSSVPAGASGQVSINLKAPGTSVAHAPLVVVADLRNSAGQILAQASDAKAMYLTPALSYELTAATKSVQPGQMIQFTVTVTNRSSASQDVLLQYDVPQFTSSYTHPAGTLLPYQMGYVTAGATQKVTLYFTALTGAQAPNGSLFTLVVSDRANGAVVSESATVNQ